MNEHDISHLAKLCRIECSDEDKKRLGQNLAKVLGYIKQLDELDTQNIAPCTHVIESTVSVLRDDEVKDLLAREELLANAPAHVGGMIRVPPVIKFNP